MRVTVISKSGCHLCDMVIDALRSLSAEREGLEIRVLDILDDGELHDKYWIRVPVVLVDEKEVFDANDMGRPETLRAQLEKLVT